MIHRSIFLSAIILVLLGSCNNALNKNYSPINFESDILEIRENQKIPEEDIRLLTDYILVARLGNQDLEGKSYSGILERIKEVRKISKEAFDKHENLQLFKRQLLNPLIKVSLVQKEFIKIKNRDYLVYTVAFRNLTEKKIRTVIGDLSIEDLLEKEIKSIYVLFNEELGAMASTTKTYKMEYEYSNESDQRIRLKNLTDLRIKWNPEKIIYGNGKMVE